LNRRRKSRSSTLGC